MKNFDEVTWVVLSLFSFMIVAGSIITYSEQQQRGIIPTNIQ